MMLNKTTHIFEQIIAPVDSQPLEVRLQQCLSSAIDDDLRPFCPLPSEANNRQQQFLWRYQQAKEQGKFTFTYVGETTTVTRQFADDLSLLYSLMQPENETTTMDEMEHWLIALMPDNQIPADITLPNRIATDEEKFLTLAFSSFQLVAKHNYETLLDKVREELQKNLIVDWEQSVFQPAS